MLKYYETYRTFDRTKKKAMETTVIIDKIKDTFNITRSRSVVARAGLSKYHFISRGKHTFHIHDVFYMVYGFLYGPGNFRDSDKFYKEMSQNYEFIVESFNRMQIIGFENIRNVTFGQWYIIVNCNDPIYNFTYGKIENIYTDRSKTISGNILNDFFKQLT